MRFKKGEPRPPNAGRKPNGLNKTTKALKEMILGALNDEGGQAYLSRQARENPVAFLALLGKILPTTVIDDQNNKLFVGMATLDLRRIAMSRLIAAGLSEDRALSIIDAREMKDVTPGPE